MKFLLGVFKLLIPAVLFLCSAHSVMAEKTAVRVGLVAYTYDGEFTTYIDHEDDMQKALPGLLRSQFPEIQFEIR